MSTANQAPRVVGPYNRQEQEQMLAFNIRELCNHIEREPEEVREAISLIHQMIVRQRVRLCRKCRKQIGHHHKYTCVQAGQRLCEHRDCNDPKLYA